MKSILALFTLLPAIALGQSLSVIPFQDISSKDAPAILQGEGRISTEHAATFTINLRNVSTKEIIAVVAKVGTFYTLEHDHFYKPIGVLPGNVIEMGHVENLTLFSKLPLEMRVLFVEFADGSTWGDRQAGEDLLQRRRACGAFLTALQEAYQAEGYSTVHSRLVSESKNKDSLARGLAAGLLMTEQQPAGEQMVMTHIEMRVKAAQDHAAIAEY
jgi:hypothetical protein